jgi:hypothetical protein
VRDYSCHYAYVKTNRNCGVYLEYIRTGTGSWQEKQEKTEKMMVTEKYLITTYISGI